MNIGRRGFLGILGGAAGWLGLKPLRALAQVETVASIPVNFNDIVIGQWADYFPASLRKCSVKPLNNGAWSGMIHPFFARDLLNLRPKPPKRAPGLNNQRERQAAMLSIARQNSFARKML